MIKEINIHNNANYHIYTCTLLHVQQKKKNILPNMLLYCNVLKPFAQLRKMVVICIVLSHLYIHVYKRMCL